MVRRTIRWRRGRWLAVLALVLAAAALVGWAIGGRRAGETWILGVTRGPRHLQPPVAMSTLRLYCPDWLCTRLGWERPLVIVDPGLALWLGVGPADTSWSDSPGGRVWCVDSLGFENRAHCRSFTHTDSDGAAIHVQAFDHFPRRQSSFLARVYGAGAAPRVDAERWIPVPRDMRVVEGSWVPESLPAGRVMPGGVCTLRAMEVRGGSSHWPAQATLDLSLPVGGDGLRLWRVREVEVRDAMGNLMRIDSGPPDLVDSGDGLVRVRWPLWSDETAWKVALTLVPARAEALAAGEAAWVRDLVVPPKDGLTRLDWTLDLVDVGVELLGLVGEHATMPGREHDVEGVTTLEMLVRGQIEGSELLLLEPRDEQGRAIELLRLGDATDASVAVGIPEGVRSLSFAVAVLRLPRVEFRVHPEFRR